MDKFQCQREMANRYDVYNHAANAANFLVGNDDGANYSKGRLRSVKLLQLPFL